ncbi:hypothetical protein F511_23717 [Dorcoceras hygrometricum]|uniref:Uncharacterized protein n=1 Tax=Dorcoceras hygrometricum TaxID=472368 RepID=A0A2Z7BFB5_9LAMI|nr:hypothetical protein F511_23717 [Dorcoceras hygrometricum]
MDTQKLLTNIFVSPLVLLFSSNTAKSLCRRFLHCSRTDNKDDQICENFHLCNMFLESILSTLISFIPYTAHKDRAQRNKQQFVAAMDNLCDLMIIPSLVF